MNVDIFPTHFQTRVMIEKKKMAAREADAFE